MVLIELINDAKDESIVYFIAEFIRSKCKSAQNKRNNDSN